MAGKEMREKRKKHKKSLVVIPADSGSPLATHSRESSGTLIAGETDGYR